MKFTIIPTDKFKSSIWTGGTTTQLFIYPETADYRLQDFNFRLSSAKVEMEESNFTPLPGVSRKLMILNGKIIIHHKNYYTRELNKFDTDEFEGEWETSSIGKCTDFNLMTRGKTSGVLTKIIIKKNKKLIYNLVNLWDWQFFYVYSGRINLKLKGKHYSINHGELLVINNPATSNLQFEALENCELIVSKIASQKD